MPRIFDNIDESLLSALRQTMGLADHADFCVGYFNLRGWKQLDATVEKWGGGEGGCCRLLVGMQRLPEEELRTAMSLLGTDGGLDNQTALRLKRKMAEEFREQLTIGAPTNEDEAGLRRLARQIREKKLVVKLFLRHPLHAKLYLLFRPDPITPLVGYLGSSNLTMAGLANQGELNIDVVDQDACEKLRRWFQRQWEDRWCLDISEDLCDIIEHSWAREELIPPYHIYIKIAYHLAEEARHGVSDFRIPRDFGNTLFDFQTAAVKIAAHHLNKRDGVLIGDVVGLGKTLMATAVARIFEDDQGLETLILCPKNLVRMWEDYRERYRMRARVLSLSRVLHELPDLRRYRQIIIDESQNLRNREGKRYRAIQEYIQANESKCILLSATPYNKTYLDLSSQLRLFVPEYRNLGIRPERYLREIGEVEFIRRHQSPVHSIAAFEHSAYADDWRELMRLYMVRRTRSFIKDNYAQTDQATNRKYLVLENGARLPFPDRTPRTVKFAINDGDPQDQYARLYSDTVVDTINALDLPRYGLGNYLAPPPSMPPNRVEAQVIANLSRAGKRLMGFCRTNLFKRLESSGQSFLLSVERHILRNYVFLHALDTGKPLPIGVLGAELLDEGSYDGDTEALIHTATLFDVDDQDSDEDGEEELDATASRLRSIEAFQRRAAEVYGSFAGRYHRRFKWLEPSLFDPILAQHLRSDAARLLDILHAAGDWDVRRDAKLAALRELVAVRHPDEKIMVFSQFADTVLYLEDQLRKSGVPALACATGESPDPTLLAWRFSPVSNAKRDRIAPENELRVLLATDVLSEGQNLQDGHIVVNYDLPWAIIRLVQRAGRVDRIGQQAEEVVCYSFLPAEGVERIINLRTRVRQRLTENAEVVGTDEAFFEDDTGGQVVLDLYNEKTGIMDGDAEGEVDLASEAYQIWKNAIAADPSVRKIVEEMPPVVYSTRKHVPRAQEPPGVLVYVRTAEGSDSLAWIDQAGKSVTESQRAILRAAACDPNTPALPRMEEHHQLVQSGIQHILEEEKAAAAGGQLGRPSGARFRTYQRLQAYAQRVQGTLFLTDGLVRAIEDIYRYPLRSLAVDALNRQLRSGISDEGLAELVVALRDEGRLCQVEEGEPEEQEPRILCSLGLIAR